MKVLIWRLRTFELEDLPVQHKSILKYPIMVIFSIYEMMSCKQLAHLLVGNLMIMMCEVCVVVGVDYIVQASNQNFNFYLDFNFNQSQ